jgi:hypothetical protein
MTVIEPSPSPSLSIGIAPMRPHSHGMREEFYKARLSQRKGEAG